MQWQKTKANCKVNIYFVLFLRYSSLLDRRHFESEPADENGKSNLRLPKCSRQLFKARVINN